MRWPPGVEPADAFVRPQETLEAEEPRKAQPPERLRHPPLPLMACRWSAARSRVAPTSLRIEESFMTPIFFAGAKGICYLLQTLQSPLCLLGQVPRGR